jgi:hypothetical protein
MSGIFGTFLFMESLSEGDGKVQVVVEELEQASALEGGQSCTHRGERLRERNESYLLGLTVRQEKKGGRSFFRDHLG